MSLAQRTAWDGFLPRKTLVMSRMGVPQAEVVAPSEVKLLCEGDSKAALFFVDAISGEQVGEEQQLFDRMISALGLRREDVCVCRVTSDVVQEFFAHIDRVTPKAVVTLGAAAAKLLLGMAEFSGKLQDFRGTKLMVTYHPGDLLKDASLKRQAWNDLQTVAREAGIELPVRKG
jgi:DNA polymerase